MDNLFDLLNYKDFIFLMIKKNRHLKGYRAGLAKIAGVQPSYLSQVLNNRAHLNLEQAILLTKNWGLNERETEYFLLLVEWARAGSKSLKFYFESRCLNIKKEQSRVLNNLPLPPHTLNTEDSGSYYSRWYIAAVHLLCGLEKNLEKKEMAEFLSISEEETELALRILEQLGAIEKKDGRYVNTRKNLHSPENSPFSYWHHMNWKMKALNDIQANQKQSIHYTTLHSLSLNDLETLKKMILEFIAQTRHVIDPSPPETLVCLSLDLFKVIK